MGFRHGDTKKRLYRIWGQMKNRCHNPKTPRYKDYGGRGITVCDEWHDYLTFKQWAMANGYDDALSIDRIDNNKGYSPDNCRWVTNLIQGNNSRHNHMITYKDKTQSMSDWSRELGLSFHLLSNRINSYGWDVERAFTTPVGNQGRKRKEKYHDNT